MKQHQQYVKYVPSGHVELQIPDCQDTVLEGILAHVFGAPSTPLIAVVPVSQADLYRQAQRRKSLGANKPEEVIFEGVAYYRQHDLDMYTAQRQPLPRSADLDTRDIYARYQRMVTRIARSLLRHFPHSHELSDLMQIGYLTILTSLPQYDMSPERGSIGLGGFMKMRVRGALLNELNRKSRPESKNAWHPRWVLQKYRENQAMRGLPTDAVTLAKKAGMSVEKYLKVIQGEPRTVYLDAPIDGEDSLTLHEVLPSDEGVKQIENAGERVMLHNIRDRTRLTPQEYHVIDSMYGSANDTTNAEVGRGVGVSREAIRKNRKSALAKLRIEAQPLFGE